jgi:hypothetical protein
VPITCPPILVSFFEAFQAFSREQSALYAALNHLGWLERQAKQFAQCPAPKSCTAPQLLIEIEKISRCSRFFTIRPYLVDQRTRRLDNFIYTNALVMLLSHENARPRRRRIIHSLTCSESTLFTAFQIISGKSEGLREVSQG